VSPVVAHGKVVFIQKLWHVLHVKVGANIFHVGTGVVKVGHKAVGAIVAAISHVLAVAVHHVVVIAAVLPGQLRGKASKGVEDGPRNDHVVVDAYEECDSEHSVAKSLEQRSNPSKKFVRTKSCILANGQLKYENKTTLYDERIISRLLCA
jgi:hypothetical protein